MSRIINFNLSGIDNQRLSSKAKLSMDGSTRAKVFWFINGQSPIAMVLSFSMVNRAVREDRAPKARICQ